MKLTAFLLLLLITTNTLAQQRSINGTANGNCFNNIGYTLSYSFNKMDSGDEDFRKGDYKVECSVAIQVSLRDAIFNHNGKTYRPTDLGFSQWPSGLSSSLTINFSVNHANSVLFTTNHYGNTNTPVRKTFPVVRRVTTGTYSFQTHSTTDIKTTYQIQGGGTLNGFSVSDCSISIDGVEATGCSGFEEIVRKIEEKESTSGSSGSSNSSSNTGSSGSSSTSSTTSSSYGSSTSSSSTSSSIYNEQNVALMGTAVDAGISFFDGLAANARAKKEKKINDKLEEAENEIKKRNLQDCNTPRCNDDKGDIYMTAASEGMKTLGFRFTYTPEIWRIAEAYYTKAANEGNIHAMKQLVYYYHQSNIKNDDKAKYWVAKLLSVYEVLANKGDILYMHYTAQIYDNTDNGYHKDLEDNAKAIYWYEQAAANGNILAQERLIDVYKDGKVGQKKDYIKALKYAKDLFNHKRAKPEKKKAAQKEIVDMYSDGGHGIDKNPQLAKEWKAKVPDLYDDFSYNLFGWLEQETKATVSSIKNGRFYFQTNEPNTWVNTITANCYQDRDFEISANIRKVEGADSVWFGLLLGSDKKFANFHALIMSGNGGYGLIRKSKASAALMDTRPASFTKSNNYNKLTIRKMGDKLRIYMNGVFSAEAPFEGFFGNDFGFVIISNNAKFAIEADDFVIRELKPGD